MGPPWGKAGWFQAHLVYARGVSDAGRRSAIEEAFARLQRGGFASAAERINLERRLVSLLTRGCERVAVGYRVKREAINDDYSEGVENIGWDAQTGLGSAVFLRTVKLKDFPWNGWLRVGVPSRRAIVTSSCVCAAPLSLRANACRTRTRSLGSRPTLPSSRPRRSPTSSSEAAFCQRTRRCRSTM